METIEKNLKNYVNNVLTNRGRQTQDMDYALKGIELLVLIQEQKQILNTPIKDRIDEMKTKKE